MGKIAKSMLPMMLVCLVAGIVLAVLAPYGTHVYAPIYRGVYWLGLCLAGGFGAMAADLIAVILKRKLTPWQTALAQSVTSTIAVASIILILTLVSYGMPSAKHFFQTLFYVWVIAMVIASIGALLNKQAGTQARPLLFERLQPRIRSGEIYALAAEDHYVRVITSKGDELLLMRLKDAIKETAPLNGLSPHRSWWVAEAGAKNVRKSGIVLHSGQNVPISRTGLKAVREAGWI